MNVEEMDGRLLWLLRWAGDEWGPRGVLKAAEALLKESQSPSLYVNSPRTEPVPGDVVRDADDEEGTESWNSCGGGYWYDRHGIGAGRSDMPARLRLLVDGTSGQVVPS